MCIGVIAVAQGCYQSVLQSISDPEGNQTALNTAAIHWVLPSAGLCQSQMCIGVVAVAQGCCQTVMQSKTELEGVHSTLLQYIGFCPAQAV